MGALIEGKTPRSKRDFPDGMRRNTGRPCSTRLAPALPSNRLPTDRIATNTKAHDLQRADAMLFGDSGQALPPQFVTRAGETSIKNPTKAK